MTDRVEHPFARDPALRLILVAVFPVTVSERPGTRTGVCNW